MNSVDEMSVVHVAPAPQASVGSVPALSCTVTGTHAVRCGRSGRRS